MQFIRDFLVVLGCFLFVFLVYYLSPNTTSFDSRWFLHQGLSVLREKNLDLDEYQNVIPLNDYRVEVIKGHLYSYFPVGTVLLSLPILNIIDHVFLLNGVDLYHQAMKVPPDSSLWEVERFIASVITTLTAVIIYLMAREQLNIKKSLLFCGIFAFCTPAFSVASRGMWSHGPEMLMLAIFMYLYFLSEKEGRRWVIQLGSLPLALWFIIRPTGIVLLFLFLVYLFYKRSKFFFLACFWALIPLLMFFFVSNTLYGSWLPSYYEIQRVGIHPHFFEALIGNLISPSRGLLVYSPLFLLSLLYFMIALLDKRITQFDILLFLMLISQYIIFSAFPAWWSGHSYGQRYLSSMTPIFIYFLLPYFTRSHKGITTSIVSILITVSFIIHVRGAVVWGTWLWNVNPSNIDVSTERLWDWRDPAFLRR